MPAFYRVGSRVGSAAPPRKLIGKPDTGGRSRPAEAVRRVPNDLIIFSMKE